MNAIKVWVIEPDPLRRQGLIVYLDREDDINVVGSGKSIGKLVVSKSEGSISTDVLIINIDSIEARELRFWAVCRIILPPTARIMALSSVKDEQLLETLMSVGVFAIYPLDAEPDRLCQAVRNVYEGYLDYHLMFSDLLKRALMFPPEATGLHIGELSVNLSNKSIRIKGEPVYLTSREKEVLALVGEGKTNRQIGQSLSITTRTVSFHVSNILKKLEVSSRVEAAIVSRWIGN